MLWRLLVVVFFVGALFLSYSFVPSEGNMLLIEQSNAKLFSICSYVFVLFSIFCLGVVNHYNLMKRVVWSDLMLGILFSMIVFSFIPFLVYDVITHSYSLQEQALLKAVFQVVVSLTGLTFCVNMLSAGTLLKKS